jgi:hypothetical protein
VARKFLAELMDHNELRGLSSDEHFSVDGTQIAAWASMKSFRAKDGSDDQVGEAHAHTYPNRVNNDFASRSAMDHQGRINSGSSNVRYERNVEFRIERKHEFLPKRRPWRCRRAQIYDGIAFAGMNIKEFAKELQVGDLS